MSLDYLDHQMGGHKDSVVGAYDFEAGDPQDTWQSGIISSMPTVDLQLSGQIIIGSITDGLSRFMADAFLKLESLKNVLEITVPAHAQFLERFGPFYGGYRSPNRQTRVKLINLHRWSNSIIAEWVFLDYNVALRMGPYRYTLLMPGIGEVWAAIQASINEMDTNTQQFQLSPQTVRVGLFIVAGVSTLVAILEPTPILEGWALWQWQRALQGSQSTYTLDPQSQTWMLNPN